MSSLGYLITAIGAGAGFLIAGTVYGAIFGGVVTATALVALILIAG